MKQAQSDYMTTSEVALELRCTPATVRNYANSGKLKPAVTQSGTRIFSAPDVLRLKREMRKAGKR